MADTWTTIFGFQQPEVNADSNIWGGILNTDLTLIETAITGISTVSLAGLSTYSLTVNQGTPDQRRSLIYNFTGAPSANCLVTIPQKQRIGWAIEATTGGHTVTMTTGGGGTNLLLNKGFWNLWYCDGINITTVPVHFGDINALTLALSGGIVAGGYSGGPVSGTTATFSDQMDVVGANLLGAKFRAGASAPGATAAQFRSDRTDGFLEVFLFGTTAVGSISTNGATTAYFTTSDYRLKVTFGVADTGAIIDAVPVHDAAWKHSPDQRQPMMLAHELAAVCPWAVSGEKDATDVTGDIVAQQADYPSLVAVLWAEVQSLRRRLAAAGIA